jgi:hypothetical protein
VATTTVIATLTIFELTPAYTTSLLSTDKHDAIHRNPVRTSENTQQANVGELSFHAPG